MSAIQRKPQEPYTNFKGEGSFYDSVLAFLFPAVPSWDGKRSLVTSSRAPVTLLLPSREELRDTEDLDGENSARVVDSAIGSQAEVESRYEKCQATYFQSLRLTLAGSQLESRTVNPELL